MNFNDEWKDIKLEQIAKFRNGKNISKEERSESGSYPIFGSNGIIGKTNKILTDEETIVIGRVGAYCGSLLYSDQAAWITDNAIACTIKNNDTKFIYYLLKTIPIRKMAGGSAQPLINQSILKNINLKIPSLKEQKSIAEILSILDEKIELNYKMNKTLEKIMQTIFKGWFIDFKPFQDGKFEESQLGKIPKKWDVVSFNELFDFVKGKTPKDKSKEDKDGYLKYLTISVLSGKKLVYASPEKAVLTEEDDILMVMDGSRSGKIFYGLSGVVASTLAKINIINKAVSKEFIYLLLKNYETEFMKHTTGSAVPHADKKYILNKKIALPDNDTLVEFNNIIEKLRSKIIANKREIQTLKEIRNIILPKLISGKLKVM